VSLNTESAHNLLQLRTPVGKPSASHRVAPH
jgi:hypothetical protein